METFSEWSKLNETLSINQRRAAGRRMARLSKKIQKSKKRNEKRLASKDVLRTRSMKAARSVLAKKLLGGKSREDLDINQRAQLDRKLDQKQAAISKISKKLFPKVVQAERERLAAFRGSNSAEE